MPTRLPLALLMLSAVGGAGLLAARCDLGAADAAGVVRDEAREAVAPLLAPDAAVARSPEPSLQGRRATGPTSPAPTGVHVRVVARAGRPVTGRHVVARWTTGDPPVERSAQGTTDEDGEVLLPDVPHDGSARVGTWAGDDVPPLAEADPRVTGPTLGIRLERLLEARVVCVDAESGLEVDVAGASLFDGETSWQGLVDAPGGELVSLHAGVVPPAGYVAWDDDDWTSGVGQWTREITAVYPLRREMEVGVTVLDHTGHFEPRAQVVRFRVAGRTASWQGADAVGAGRFQLRGVPYLRGEPLVVWASAPYLRYPVSQEVALPSHPADRTELEFVLPAPGTQPQRDNTVIGIGGGSSSRFCCGRGSHRRGGLEIGVLRHDGSPAAGATVKVGVRSLRLDERGTFRDPSFPVGTWTVETSTVGLLPVTGEVVVREGETAHLLLREPRGGAVEVRVVDEDGDPVSFAELYVATSSGASWVDEHDGVQRIDPFTDHVGRRRLTRVETGAVELTARWGSRRGKTGVEVREDHVTRVTLVVR